MKENEPKPKRFALVLLITVATLFTISAALQITNAYDALGLPEGYRITYALFLLMGIIYVSSFRGKE